MNVFLTGASSGIGAALAQVYAAQGARLGLVARRQAQLDELAASLPGGDKTKALTYAVDVTDRDALIDAARRFEAETGGADVVIANAGISFGVLTEYYEDLEKFTQVLQTNVVSMAHTFHPFIAPMRKRRGGTLVGIASVAGIRGMPGSEAYCASKAAAISYLESLRVEMKPFGIRVLTICPGFVRTPLVAKNPYQMPFLLEPAQFAERAVRAIAARKSYTVIPWQMAIGAKVLRLLPNWLFDKAFGKRPYKPRSTAQ